jgi:integrase
MPSEHTIALIRSKRRPRPPTELSQAEVERLLAAMTVKHAFMARLRYGGGLCLLECLRLRIKDIVKIKSYVPVTGSTRP